MWPLASIWCWGLGNCGDFLTFHTFSNKSNLYFYLHSTKHHNYVSGAFLFNFMFQYGLYGSFLGCFLYILFGSCKDVPMGPTAIVSLLTFQQVGNLGTNAPYYAILLCFLAGCVEFLMGILGLGECKNLFWPVINSYTIFFG